MRRKVCSGCGKIFTPYKIGQRFCSIECLEGMAIVNEKKLEKECVRCGKKFIPKGSAQKYCSVYCRDHKDTRPAKEKTDWVEIQRRCLELHMSYGEAVREGLI